MACLMSLVGVKKHKQGPFNIVTIMEDGHMGVELYQVKIKVDSTNKKKNNHTACLMSAVCVRRYK